MNVTRPSVRAARLRAQAPRNRVATLLTKSGAGGGFTLIAWASLVLFVAYVWAANHEFRWPWTHTVWLEQTVVKDPDGRATDINDIVFVDPLRGWAVGERGTILATQDGGKTWARQTSGTAYTLRSVDFLDERRGWVVGAWNTVLNTLDGGASWQPLTPETSNFPSSVKFVDERVGWMAGGSGELRRTEDGGRTWTQQRGGSTVGGGDGGFREGGISGLAVLNDRYAWIGGVGGFLAVTEDGGRRWTRFFADIEGIGAVFFIDERTGWYAGEKGRIFRTDNRGQTWRRQASPSSSAITDLFFLDRNVGWAVGASSTILHTTDGGRSWKNEDSGVVKNLVAVTAIDRNSAWAAGQGGIILRYRG